jgi:hypothetical protein
VYFGGHGGMQCKARGRTIASYGNDEQRSNAPAMTSKNCAGYFLNVP